MSTKPSTVLVIGATGSIGLPVVEEAVREGYAVRALVRDLDRASQLPPDARPMVGKVSGRVTSPTSTQSYSLTERTRTRTQRSASTTARSATLSLRSALDGSESL